MIETNILREFFALARQENRKSQVLHGSCRFQLCGHRFVSAEYVLEGSIVSLNERTTMSLVAYT